MWLLVDQSEIIPINDLRPHVEGFDCWCHPEEDDGLLIHNSMDGREDFEEGKRIPS